MYHSVYGDWSSIPSWFPMKEASFGVGDNDEQGRAGQGQCPSTAGLEKQCGRRCWSQSMTVAVETAASVMMRRPNKCRREEYPPITARPRSNGSSLRNNAARRESSGGRCMVVYVPELFVHFVAPKELTPSASDNLDVAAIGV